VVGQQHHGRDIQIVMPGRSRGASPLAVGVRLIIEGGGGYTVVNAIASP